MDDEPIPCEICNSMVSFSGYNSHLRHCSRMSQLTSLFANQNVRIEPEEDDVDEMQDNDITTLTRYFHNNAQVSRTTLSDFINNHFNGQRSVIWFNIAVNRPSAQTAQTALTASSAIGEEGYDENVRLGEMIGSVEIGLSDKQIDEISFSSSDKNEINVSEDDLCAICQDNICKVIESGETNACVLACTHTYCEPCIKTWLGKSKKCPVCMIDLEDAFLWGR